MSNFFRDRVHLADDLDKELQQWPHKYRDDIIITPAGPYVVRQEDFFTVCRPAGHCDFRKLFGRGSDAAALLAPGNMRLQTLVPWEFLTQATYFFRVVWQRWEREDVLLLYYFFEEQRYKLLHPELTSASANVVEYEFPNTPAKAVRFGSFHLHAREHAYHSHADRDDDEVSPGVHVIVGNVEKPLCTLACVGSDGQHCFPISLLDVFKQPPVQSFPDDWLVANVPRHAPNNRSRARSDRVN